MSRLDRAKYRPLQRELKRLTGLRSRVSAAEMRKILRQKGLVRKAEFKDSELKPVKTLEEKRLPFLRSHTEDYIRGMSYHKLATEYKRLTGVSAFSPFKKSASELIEDLKKQRLTKLVSFQPKDLKKPYRKQYLKYEEKAEDRYIDNVFDQKRLAFDNREALMREYDRRSTIKGEDLEPLAERIIEYTDFIDKQDKSIIGEYAEAAARRFGTIFKDGIRGIPDFKTAMQYAIDNRYVLKFKNVRNWARKELSVRLGQEIKKNQHVFTFRLSGYPDKEEGLTLTQESLKNVIEMLADGYLPDEVAKEYGAWVQYQGDYITSMSLKPTKFVDAEHKTAKEKKAMKLKENGDGGYFRYSNRSRFDLSRYQIHQNPVNSASEKHCLIHSLKLAGIKKDKLDLITFAIAEAGSGLNYPTGRLGTRIVPIIGRSIHLSKYVKGKHRPYTFTCKGSEEPPIELGIYLDHYVFNEDVNMTIMSANHWDDPRYDLPNISRLYTRTEATQTTDEEIPIMKFLNALHKSGAFVPVALDEKDVATNLAHGKIYENPKVITTIPDTEDVKRARKFKPDWIVVADFEAITEGYHTQFTVSYRETTPDFHKTDMKSLTKDKPKSIVGLDCAKKLLERLKPNTLCYMHNAKYDMQFIMPHVESLGICMQGSQFYQVKAKHDGNILLFLDSYKMIRDPLRNFPKLFMSKDERIAMDFKKEVFPYDAVKVEHLDDPWCDIEKAKETIKDKTEHKEFIDMIHHLDLVNDAGDKFDIIEYAKYYCNRDVDLLFMGLIRFREQILKKYKLDIYNYMTISSMAFDYSRIQGCYKGVHKLTGLTRASAQRALYGGRCMLANNEHQFAIRKISDLDATALYPAACYWMCQDGYGYPKGAPQIIPPDKLTLEFIMKQDYFNVAIDMLSIGKHRSFAIASIKVEGVRLNENQLFTNIMVDKIMLEDMIEFQDVKVRITWGMYWNQGFNTNIGTVMREIFDDRCALRKAGNPQQKSRKDMMNMIFGKNGQKANDVQMRFLKHGQMSNYILKNSTRLIGYTKFNENQYLVKERVPILAHSNHAHCASIILSYSKRMMYRVMYLAEDNGIEILMHATDSMHLDFDDIPRLNNLYRAKYGKELIGKDMGDFHSDFSLSFKHPRAKLSELKLDTKDCPVSIDKLDLGKSKMVKIKFDPSVVYSTTFIAVRKKVYFDKLESVYLGKVYKGLHFRMKGMSIQGVLMEAKKKGGMEPLYTRLYNGEYFPFDVLAGGKKVCFSVNPQWRTKHMKKFTRLIGFGKTAKQRMAEEHECELKKIAAMTSTQKVAYIIAKGKLRRKIARADRKKKNTACSIIRAEMQAFIDYHRQIKDMKTKEKPRPADTRIPFGKHAGNSLGALYKVKAHTVVWMHDKCTKARKYKGFMKNLSAFLEDADNVAKSQQAPENSYFAEDEFDVDPDEIQMVLNTSEHLID